MNLFASLVSSGKTLRTFSFLHTRREPHPPPPLQNLRRLTTRWSTTLSSKVNLPHAIDFRALCGTVTSKLTRKLRVNGTLELHCVDRVTS